MTTGADWVDSARRLLDALRPAADGAAATAPADAGTASATSHEPDCRWCPVCSAAAVLRGERPEVTAALADVLATTSAMLRDLAGEPDQPSAPPADAAACEDRDRDRDQGQGQGQDEGQDEAPGTGPVPVPVQRIDII